MHHRLSRVTRLQKLNNLELDSNTVVNVSRSSWHSNISYSSKGDFVLFKDSESSNIGAGKVQLHFDVAGMPCSIIELYELVSRRDNYLEANRKHSSLDGN